MKENSPYIGGEGILLQTLVHPGHHTFTKEIKQTTFTKVSSIIEAGYTLGPIVTINNDFPEENKLLYFNKARFLLSKATIIAESPLFSFADLIECGFCCHSSRDITEKLDLFKHVI